MVPKDLVGYGADDRRYETNNEYEDDCKIDVLMQVLKANSGFWTNKLNK